MREHPFTNTIRAVLVKHFGDAASDILSASPLLQYLNEKTRSANSGSKSRGAFATHYALYVLIEDYVKHGFEATHKGQYAQYQGASFIDLFRRQRQLPFGAKLQNHALNSRVNKEFSKYYPTLDVEPIMHNKQKYWIAEQLLLVRIAVSGEEIEFNIATAILNIIDLYVQEKLTAFEKFLETCKAIATLSVTDVDKASQFIQAQLEPTVDARIFEIVSYAILKAHYVD